MRGPSPSPVAVAVAVAIALALVGVGACKTEPERAAGDPAVAADPPMAPAPPTGKVVIETPARGPVADVVQTFQAREAARNRKVVVYVGAPWCEPCQRFHKAVAEGKLDATFPNLTLLEFNLDEDRERLAAAGYTSEFIPLFVRPSKDGSASTQRFAGSVKGDGAVANITPKLRALLSEAN